jgi:hypothetical protein
LLSIAAVAIHKTHGSRLCNRYIVGSRIAPVAQQLSFSGKEILMKGKYVVASVLAFAGIALYIFLRRKNAEEVTQPNKASERHHLTNAFSKAKQAAMGR